MSSCEQVINLSQSFWQLQTANAILNSSIMRDIQQMQDLAQSPAEHFESEVMRHIQQDLVQSPAEHFESEVMRHIQQVQDLVQIPEEILEPEVMRHMQQVQDLVQIPEEILEPEVTRDITQALGFVPTLKEDLFSFCFGEQYPWIFQEFPTLSTETKAFLGTTISIKPKDPLCYDEKKVEKKNVESDDFQIGQPDTKVQQTFNDFISKVEFRKDTDIDTSTVKNMLDEFICITNEASELIPIEIRKPVKEIQGNINRALLKPKVLTVLFVKNLTLSIFLTLYFSGATLIGNLVNFETNVTLNKTDVTQIENNNTNDIIVINNNPQITINGDVENPQDVIDQCLERQAELFAEIIKTTLQNE